MSSRSLCPSALLAFALAAGACRGADERSAPSRSSARAATDGAAPASSRLVLYPGAPTAPWGVKEFFDPNGSEPKTQLVYGRVEARGALAVDEVVRAVRLHDNSLRYCYWLGLTHEPRLRGTLVVSFEIDPAGAATRGETRGSDLSDPRVADCLVAVLSLLAFPARAAPTGVTLPLDLSPG